MVKSLRRESQHSIVTKGLIVRALLLIFLSTIGILYIIRNLTFQPIIGLTWLVLWFLLGGKFSSLPSYSVFLEIRKTRLFLLHLLAILLVGILYLFYFEISKKFNAGWLPTMLQLRLMLYGPILIFLGLFLVVLVSFFTVNPYYYSLVCHSGGALLSSIAIYVIHGRLSSFEGYLKLIKETSLAYFFWLLFAVIFYIFIHRLEVGERK